MFSSLSDKQKKIVFEKSGKFVVRASPGSGKTYSVTARVAHRMQNWEHKRSGIATLSFTNVAWKEIEKYLRGEFGLKTPVSYPHFLGTLDSFINKYIFLPFGHLVMGCQKRPVLVGEPHNSWNWCPYIICYEQYFDIVSYNIDESLVYPEIQGVFFFGYPKIYKSDGTESQHAANLRKIKQKFWQEGYANQRDANYFAFRVLEKYPVIAKALVARFPKFIIDEAQDTTEVQMKLIDILIENGLDEVMLIGDPDQAIFEWNNAKPELFNQKYELWKENSIESNENRRSSQRICDFTVKLTSLSNAPIAINNEVKDCNFPIKVVSYDHNETDSVQGIIKTFIKKCRQNGIDTKPEKVVVLFRSRDFVNTISGAPSKSRPVKPWIADDAITRDMVKAKFLIDNHCYKDGYKLLEKSFIKVIISKRQCIDEDIQARVDEMGFVQHRKEVYKIADLLPSTENIDIRTWITIANRALKDNRIEFEICDNVQILVKNLFQKEIPVVSEEYRLGTVHSVKGETFDAVLLLLKQKGAKGKYYKTLLNNGTKTDESEELRIVYVAITRPRKLLMIAVPDKDISSWENLL